jgi:hypothetical protein
MRRPPVPTSLPLYEEAHYDIQYGLLGSVGQLGFSVGGLTGPDGSEVVNVHGAGAGAVWGLGGMERRIDAEFDPRALGSRRWSVVRLKTGQHANEETIDTAARGDRDAILLERKAPGQPPSRQTVTFAAPTSDPLGILWRLRTAPPALHHTETLQVLDGLLLWRVRVTTTAIDAPPPEGDVAAMRLEGEVIPILFDGRIDPDRPTRRFTLWLSDKTNHLPLRLEVPFGPSDVIMTLDEVRKLAPPRQADADEKRILGPPGPVTEPPGPNPAQVGAPVPGARSL